MAVTPEMIALDLGITEPEPGSATYLQWELWIQDAVFLVEERRIKVGAQVIDPDKLDYVVRKAVVAHIQKPDDATTVTVAVDDGSSTRRYESGVGRVSVDGWWDFLDLDEIGAGAFTIRPAGRNIEEEEIFW